MSRSFAYPAPAPPPPPTQSTQSWEYQFIEFKSNWTSILYDTIFYISTIAVSTSALYYGYNKIKRKQLQQILSNRYIDSTDYIHHTTTNNNTIDQYIDSVQHNNINQLDKDTVINESELIQLIEHSTDTITEHNTVNDDMSQYLYNTLLQLQSYTTMTYDTRICIARYLLLYHNYYNSSSTDLTESNQLEHDSVNILHKINSILNNNSNDTVTDVQQRITTQLLLDTAIKLHSYPSIQALLLTYIQYDIDNTITLEELMIIFTSSIYTGQWNNVYKYGTRIIELRDTLNDFHHASELNCGIPDYESLYQLSHTYNTNIPVSDIQLLYYRQYQAIQFRLKLSHVECADIKRADQVHQLLTTQHTLNWQSRDCDGNDICIVNGGFIYIQSKSQQPANLYGPYTGSTMHVMGYRTTLLNNTNTNKHNHHEYDQNNDYDTILKQTEQYILTNTSTTYNVNTTMQWSGQYKLTQETYLEQYDDDIIPRQINITTPVVVVFDMQLVLQPIQ